MTTALTGSPKQIAWAESIREQMTAEITELIQANTGSAVDTLAASMLTKALKIVETETSAKWFIDKGRHLTDLYDFCSISEPEAYSILDNAARASLVTDEQRERVKTLKDQIAIAKSELDAAIARSKEMQATHAQEYAELKAVFDGWTDEQIEGEWTPAMHKNSSRCYEIETLCEQGVGAAQAKLRNLEFELSQLIKAIGGEHLL